MQIFTIFYVDGLNTSADLWQYEREEEDLVIHPVTQVEVAAELCSNTEVDFKHVTKDTSWNTSV